MPEKLPNTTKRLLYIEDDSYCQNIVSRVLSGKYYIDFGIDADAALNLIEEYDYDAFLLDINLRQGLDGVQLMEKVKGMEKYRNTPFVAITAYVSIADRKEFLEKGFTHYLPKPFLLKDLTELVESLFN
ncbi:MAG: hypothetical protein HBSAPP04_20530 [Ignavibacteriaceae bacterium]|nr:MAG: hypothetical protein HBSAPP04_20530 [Ignavibacteriaceae bacterium]